LALGVYIEIEIPFLLAHIQHRIHRDYPGVGYQNVKGSKVSHDIVHHFLDGFAISHIGRKSCTLEFFGRCNCGLRVISVNCNARSLSCHRSGNRQTNPAGAAGDQSDPIL
jgi:hypothetical protein